MENPFLNLAQKIVRGSVFSLKNIKKRYILPLVSFLIIIFLYIILVSPPSDFPSRSIITVPSGSGLLKLSSKLKEEGVIRSSSVFRTFAILLEGERGMQAGDYYLSHPENAFRMAWRIFHGKRDIVTMRITIPEGYTVQDISDVFDSRFPRFDHEAFLKEAREGYLFPDTYFIEVSATASSTLSLLQDNFNQKVEPLNQEIQDSKHTESEIITMASILESEAQTQEDREIVSGILWKRIKLGMPLQVDASLGYLTGKTSHELTQEDLNIDSPYNTYEYKGLPPGPISNPGLESILAAIHPKESPYLYFLTDDDGLMHYAKNFDDHKKNKAKYIK